MLRFSPPLVHASGFGLGMQKRHSYLLCRFFELQSKDQISYQRISLAARSSWKLEPSPL